MFKPLSPVSLKYEKSSSSEQKDEVQAKDIDQKQLKSLEEDHSSLLKKYEQLSKTKQDSLGLNSTVEGQSQLYSKEFNQISNTPSKLGQPDQFHTAKQLMQIADYALQNEKSKEERILQQLVEDYKVTNRDLSSKLDQERQEVLDQRVKIHSLETEIKFCKKENQRLTSMIENIGTKKTSLLNQNIQEKQDHPKESQKKHWETKILHLEEQNTMLIQEKQALQHQNRLMEERLSSISNELEILKNIQQAMQLKDKKQAKDEISAKEIEIQSLKESFSILKNENLELSTQFQQKIIQKNSEIEKMLQLNSVLQEQFLQMEKKLKQKDEQMLNKQELYNGEREQILIKENENLNIELVSLNSQVKQLNEQIKLKQSKQQIEFVQLQKDYQLLTQEKEALVVQASGQQETIQMLNQQIAILERISNENTKALSQKKQSEEKSLVLIKKDLEDSKQKQLQQSKEIDFLKEQNDKLQKQIALMEEEKECLKMTKAETEDKNAGLTTDKTNYIQLIDQLQNEICSLNATLEENQRKGQEKQKQLEETIQSQKSEIANLQSINAMFEKQILNIQSQLKDKKNEVETRQQQSNNVNEMKFLEERVANLQKQNELYSQKIQMLEQKQQGSVPQLTRDNSQKRASALSLLEEGIQKSGSRQNLISNNEGEEKYKVIMKNYNQMNEQCQMQLKQIDILNQTISELQKTIKQQAQKNTQNLQIPSTSDFQDYQEPSKKKLQIEINSREGLSDNNLDNNHSPEKILIQDLEVIQDNQKLRNTTDQEKQTLIVSLQKENKRLVEKIAHVEQAFNQLNQKVDGLTRQNQNNNFNLSNLNNNNSLPPLPYPTTPVMTQNNMIFSKQFKSSEKPLQTPLQQSNQKNLDKDLGNSTKKRHKIFEPYNSNNRRHQSSDRKSPNSRYLNTSIEGNPQIQTNNYQSFNGSPSRTYQEGFGHKRQHTLPNAFISQQNFFVEQNQINYNSRAKPQEVKRPNSFTQQNQNQGFMPDQKANKNAQNEESVLLFSPINLVDQKKGVSQDDTEDLLSNGSVDSQMKQVIYPHLNVYEYYDQMQNNGSQCVSLQIVKFDRSLFSQYIMQKDNLLKYKQAIFLQKLVYLDTKEGLQIGCISQQERDQDQIYLNLNLYYKNLAQTSIDQLYVTLTGSSTCQAFAKPTVSNWSLSPNNQSKQELFFKFNSIPFGPIQAEIIYQCKDAKKKFQMHMPVNILKFLEQRTIQADRLLSKYLKIKLNPKNTAKLQNGFILKSEKFLLDRKFALNINDFAQYLPHFQRIPQIDKLGEYMMGGNDFQLGGSYLLRENNLIFYMILTIKTNKFAIFEIFSESNSQNHVSICENILQNFIYIFINPENN